MCLQSAGNGPTSQFIFNIQNFTHALSVCSAVYSPKEKGDDPTHPMVPDVQGVKWSFASSKKSKSTKN